MYRHNQTNYRKLSAQLRLHLTELELVSGYLWDSQMGNSTYLEAKGRIIRNPSVTPDKVSEREVPLLVTLMHNFKGYNVFKTT